jgi:hypothetical protein
VAGGALTLRVPHPIIARRTWLWRAEDGAVVEGLGFAGTPTARAVHDWLTGLGTMHEDTVGRGLGGVLGWAGRRPFDPAETSRLRQVARFAAAPLAALSARSALAALLEAYLGRRSAARVQAGELSRGTGETIRAVLLCADLRGFTELSQDNAPALVIAALDAWFDRVAGAVHAFGGEVLKFIGDGVLAIFPVAGPPADACEAALARGRPPPAPAWPISMRRGRRKGCRRCPSARRCISARSCGAISARPTGSTSPRSARRSTWSAGWRGCAGRSAARY